MGQEIYDGVARGTDELSKWIKDKSRKEALLLKETLDPLAVRDVVNRGYGTGLTDVQQEKMGRDPLLIAYAFGRSDRCIVTTEVRAPSRQRQNRKVPDVCDSLSVRWISGYDLLDILDFRTNWRF